MNNTVHLFFNGQQFGPMSWDEAVLRCSQDDTPVNAQVLIDQSTRISSQEFLAMNLRKYAHDFPHFFDQSSRDYWVRYDDHDKGPLVLAEWIEVLCATNAPLDAEFKVGDFPYTPLMETLRAWAGGYLEKIREAHPPVKNPSNRSLFQKLLFWILPETKILRTAVIILYLATLPAALLARTIFQDGTAALMGVHNQRTELVAQREALEQREKRGGVFSRRDFSAEKAEINRNIKDSEDQFNLLRDARLPWIYLFRAITYSGLIVFALMIGRRMMAS